MQRTGAKSPPIPFRRLVPSQCVAFLLSPSLTDVFSSQPRFNPYERFCSFSCPDRHGPFRGPLPGAPFSARCPDLECWSLSFLHGKTHRSVFVSPLLGFYPADTPVLVFTLSPQSPPPPPPGLVALLLVPPPRPSCVCWASLVLRTSPAPCFVSFWFPKRFA